MQECMNLNSGFRSYFSLRVRIPSGVRNKDFKLSCILTTIAKPWESTTKKKKINAHPLFQVEFVRQTDVLNVTGRQTKEPKGLELCAALVTKHQTPRHCSYFRPGLPTTSTLKHAGKNYKTPLLTAKISVLTYFYFITFSKILSFLVFVSVVS